MIDEKVPPFKPLSKRSKFAKPNKEGQIANNCIELCHSGRNGNCQLFKDWQDVNHPCKVVKGEYCKNFKGSVKISKDKTHIFKLTNREQEVYELLLKGFTQKKISEILGTKLSSIHSYAHIIYEKKGVSGVKELIEVTNEI